jgi:hypothetical protein
LLIRTKASHFHLATNVMLIALAAGAPIYAETALTADQIIAKVTERNRERAANLKSYSSIRTYRLKYRGFPGSRDAEMIVEARFDAPASKEFRVVSESGSKLLINRVLHRLLSSEQEAMNRENQQETALTKQNYDFTLEREEREDDHSCYVLKAQPTRKNKFLFRGYVWIDAEDFAVARIDAEPAKNPSFWISKTHIKHRYVKIGTFWLPAQNVSLTKVRLGGEATLTIDYGDYVVSGQVDGSLKQVEILGSRAPR